MNCCFCHRAPADASLANAMYLCPDCLDQLLGISPADRRYRWFIAAMRRAIADGCA